MLLLLLPCYCHCRVSHDQIPALKALVAQYKSQGLRAILVPTDQGDYEPDDSATVRIKVKQDPQPYSRLVVLELRTPRNPNPKPYSRNSQLLNPLT